THPTRPGEFRSPEQGTQAHEAPRIGAVPRRSPARRSEVTRPHRLTGHRTGRHARPVIALFFATYAAVFAAEIVGDKLLYTTGVLATRYRAVPIMLGMSLA